MRVLCKTVDDFMVEVEDPNITEFLNNFFEKLKTIELIQIHPRKESIEVFFMGLKVASIKPGRGKLSIELDTNVKHN